MIPEKQSPAIPDFRTRCMIAALLFLTALALGLWRSAPGLGWGTQPGFAAAAHALATGPKSGAAPYLLLIGLARWVMDVDPAFVLNLFSAVMFALISVLVFLTGVHVSLSVMLGMIVWFLFIALPGVGELFVAAKFEVGILLAAVVVFWAGARFVRDSDSPRGQMAFLAIGLVAALHHSMIGIAVILVTVLRFVKTPREKWTPGWVAGGVFIFACAFLPLAFTVLRSRFDLAYGWFWLSTPAQAFNLPSVQNFSDSFRPGPDVKFFLSRVPEWFIAAPRAPYFPMLVLALAGVVLMRPRHRGFSPLLGIMALFTPLALVLSTVRDTQLFQCLLFAPFFLFFAAGAGGILTEMQAADVRWIKALRPVAWVLILAAAAWGAWRNPGIALERKPVLAGMYINEWYGDLHRDAVAFINPETDAHYGPPASRILYGYRADVATFFPQEFNNPAYRSNLRLREGGGVAITSELQYEQLKNTATENTQPPEGAPENSEIMKQRVIYNLIMLNQTLMAEQNVPRRPVYFNTIQLFLRNQRFNWMCFQPGWVAYRACTIRFTQCADEYLMASPSIRLRIQNKKKELLDDRAFLEKAIAEKHRNRPWLASAWKAVLDRYFQTSESREPEQREHVNRVRASLSESLGFEPLIKEKILYPYIALMQEAAMGCDATRERYSVECVARTMQDIMGQTDLDLFPMPEGATYCFIREFHWPYSKIEEQAKRAMRSPLREDPVAAELIASHLSDAAEHAWIHNDDYLRDDDPHYIAAYSNAGYTAALKAQTAAVWIAAFMSGKEIDPAPIPVLSPPKLDEPHLASLLENAVRIAPESARARFLLALVSLEKYPHARESSDHLDAVERILKQRERTRGLSENEMYMLLEVYQKTDRRDEADKYLERIEGGSRLPLY